MSYIYGNYDSVITFFFSFQQTINELAIKVFHMIHQSLWDQSRTIWSLDFLLAECKDYITLKNKNKILKGWYRAIQSFHTLKS